MTELDFDHTGEQGCRDFAEFLPLIVGFIIVWVSVLIIMLAISALGGPGCKN